MAAMQDREGTRQRESDGGGGGGGWRKAEQSRSKTARQRWLLCGNASGILKINKHIIKRKIQQRQRRA